MPTRNGRPETLKAKTFELGAFVDGQSLVLHEKSNVRLSRAEWGVEKNAQGKSPLFSCYSILCNKNLQHALLV